MDFVSLTALANLLAGLSMAAVGIWLLTLDARSGGVRLLAGFLLSYAMTAAADGLRRLELMDAGPLNSLVGVTFAHSAVALLLVALVFPVPLHPRLTARTLPLLPVAAAILVASLLVGRDALGWSGNTVLNVSAGLGNLAYAAAFLICAVRLTRPASAPAARSLAILAMGMGGVVLAFTATITLLWWQGRNVPTNLGTVPGFVLALVAMTILAHAAFVRTPRVPLAIGPLAIATAALVSAAVAVSAGWVGAASYWRLLLPILLAWGVLRHQFLGLDARVNWTIRRGTVAAALIAAFVVASEVAQNVLSEGYGVLAGGLAAGALLVAIHPLQRMADRVANSAAPLPGTTPREVFAEAVRLALVDGTITPEEERQLAVLASRLKLSPLEALEARRTVEAAPVPP